MEWERCEKWEKWEKFRQKHGVCAFWRGNFRLYVVRKSKSSVKMAWCVFFGGVFLEDFRLLKGNRQILE